MNSNDPSIFPIVVAAVLLFFLLGIAIMTVIDHKARIPGRFRTDPFSIKGIRRDQPGVAFLTGLILVGIIASLVGALAVTLYESFKPEEITPSVLLSRIEQDRIDERRRHFHNSPETVLPEQGDKTACFFCHGDYPHSKEPMVSDHA